MHILIALFTNNVISGIIFNIKETMNENPIGFYNKMVIVRDLESGTKSVKVQVLLPAPINIFSLLIEIRTVVVRIFYFCLTLW